MRYFKTQELLDELAGHNKRVFDIADIAKITGKPTAYISKILSGNRGVRRVLRGKYYMVGLNGADMYEIASNIVFPSYVSMLAAFQFHSITEQSIVRYSVVSVKRHRPLEVEGKKIEFITLDKKRFFGYTRVRNSYIATVEKAIVDALYLGAPYDYVDEAFAKALRRKMIDIKRLEDFTIKMDSRALSGKVCMVMKDNGIKSRRLQGPAVRE